MKSDDRNRQIEPDENHDRNIDAQHEVETDAAEVQEPQPAGWVAQLQRIMRRSTQGAARTTIKRQQLKEDRTKSFLVLAGITVVLELSMGDEIRGAGGVDLLLGTARRHHQKIEKVGVSRNQLTDRCRNRSGKAAFTGDGEAGNKQPLPFHFQREGVFFG